MKKFVGKINGKEYTDEDLFLEDFEKLVVDGKADTYEVSSRWVEMGDLDDKQQKCTCDQCKSENKVNKKYMPVFDLENPNSDVLMDETDNIVELTHEVHYEPNTALLVTDDYIKETKCKIAKAAQLNIKAHRDIDDEIARLEAQITKLDQKNENLNVVDDYLTAFDNYIHSLYDARHNNTGTLIDYIRSIF